VPDKILIELLGRQWQLCQTREGFTKGEVARPKLTAMAKFIQNLMYLLRRWTGSGVYLLDFSVFAVPKRRVRLE
jgi:hypothetical protein